MALNFNPASFNPVVAGFDDLGSAVVAALGRRAERQYATEAAKRQRQQQLADLAYQTANPEDLTETDITGFDPALQAAARTRKTGAKRSAYEKRWGDTRNALGDLGRGSRAGAALGASLGADRLSLATSKEADDQAEADYQAILKGLGSPTIRTEIMEPGIGGAAPTPTGRYAEAPDPDYRSRVEMGMRKKMAELMTSGGPNARVLGRKIFTRHGDRLGDPFAKEGPIDFQGWLDSTDAVATPGAAAGAVLGAKPGLSETAKARIRLMLADPDTPLFQSPQQIEVWRSLLADDEAPAGLPYVPPGAARPAEPSFVPSEIPSTGAPAAAAALGAAPQSPAAAPPAAVTARPAPTPNTAAYTTESAPPANDPDLADLAGVLDADERYRAAKRSVVGREASGITGDIGVYGPGERLLLRSRPEDPSRALALARKAVPRLAAKDPVAADILAKAIERHVAATGLRPSRAAQMLADIGQGELPAMEDPRVTGAALRKALSDMGY